MREPIPQNVTEEGVMNDRLQRYRSFDGSGSVPLSVPGSLI